MRLPVALTLAFASLPIALLSPQPLAAQSGFVHSDRGSAMGVSNQTFPSGGRFNPESASGDLQDSPRISTVSARNSLPPPFQSQSSSASLSTGRKHYRGELLQSAKVIAHVGDQVILAGDLLGQVNQFLQPHAERLTDEQMEVQRWRLIEQLLPKAIDAKLIYVDFLRSVPAERVPDVLDSIYQEFDDKQLPKVIERAKVTTAADLDRLLRSFGSSLDSQRRSFAEQVLAQQWRFRSAAADEVISHDEMLAYYRDQRKEFEIEAKAKWEHLMTRKSEFPTSRAAHDALAAIGNQVYYGASLAAVARRKSQGPTASEGGQYDWTTQGSLVSEVLDAAIFSLPVGKLSKILEDDEGFHIVRVTERQEAGAIPFEEAQVQIREKIIKQRREQNLAEYVQELRQKTPISTIFDSDPGGSS